jgi:hypothetical protein
MLLSQLPLLHAAGLPVANDNDNRKTELSKNGLCLFGFESFALARRLQPGPVLVSIWTRAAQNGAESGSTGSIVPGNFLRGQ